MLAAPPRSRQVLVVDDEARLRELLVDVIGEMGFGASAVRTAEEAWGVVQADPPDVIILDLQLPLMGGLELLEKIRSAGIECAAIILSGFGDLKTAQRAIELNVAGFLSKPFHLNEVEQALDRATRQTIQRQLTREVVRYLPEPVGFTLASQEFQAISAALARSKGNRTAAAAELGLSRRALHYKLKAYRAQGRSIPPIDPPDTLS